MTHPMIEKCARALYEDDFGGNPEPSWADRDDEVKEAYRQNVIAVLRTLRTPDEGMVRAGSVMQAYPFPSPVEDDRKLAADSFTTMIDFILPEEKGTTNGT